MLNNAISRNPALPAIAAKPHTTVAQRFEIPPLVLECLIDLVEDCEPLGDLRHAILPFKHDSQDSLTQIHVQRVPQLHLHVGENIKSTDLQRRTDINVSSASRHFASLQPTKRLLCRASTANRRRVLRVVFAIAKRCRGVRPAILINIA